MAPVESFVNDPDPPPQAAKQPTRVVQLSKKLMAAAVSGNKSKAARPQKRPAPVLPPEAKKAGELPQELNAYAASKAKGGVSAPAPPGSEMLGITHGQDEYPLRDANLMYRCLWGIDADIPESACR